MPKSLFERAQYKIKELQCGKTELNSPVFKTKLPLGKAFFETMVLPKYGILSRKRHQMIPHGSILAEKIEKAFIDEIAKHKDKYPQGSDDEKYVTELKFQVIAGKIAGFIAERPHQDYKFSDNHLSVNHQVGFLTCIGNGGINVPFVDNALDFLQKKKFYSNVATPDYSDNKKAYNRAIATSFSTARDASKESLEESYKAINQRVFDKLYSGQSTVVVPTHERETNNAKINEVAIGDYIDPTKLNTLIYNTLYRADFDIRLEQRSFLTAARKFFTNSGKTIEASDPPIEHMHEVIKTAIFPKIEKIAQRFPTCGANYELDSYDPAADLNNDFSVFEDMPDAATKKATLKPTSVSKFKRSQKENSVVPL